MRVLLVEDDALEAELVEAGLEGVHGAEALELQRARTLGEALTILAAGLPDVVLLDLSLPDSSGLDGLDRIRRQAPRATIVMRTGHRDDDVALEAVRHGAQDYLIKGEHGPALLWRSLRHAVERARALREATGREDRERAHDRQLMEAETEMVAGMLGRGIVAATSRTPFRPGIQLGARYHLGELLGEGASSQVYRARDSTTGAEVCVKHIRTGSSEAAAKELARETRLTAALVHPRIVRILDFGTVWGEPYLVMELAHGGSLADHLRTGPLAPERAKEIMLDVLEGLAYIHAHDVLHLDLKPANVVLDDAHRAKITDFGIALHAAGREWNETQSSLGAPRIFGTPAYVAPEVVTGLPPTERSDIYSAGALLYELLAGHPYLDLRGLDLFAIRAAIREQTPSPHAPGGAVLAVALRALAKAPEDRYPSATAMREALRAALPAAGRPVSLDVLGEDHPMSGPVRGPRRG